MARKGQLVAGSMCIETHEPSGGLALKWAARASRRLEFVAAISHTEPRDQPRLDGRAAALDADSSLSGCTLRTGLRPG